MKIVSYKICPFVQRVIATLEAKDIPYEVEYLSLKNKPQYFLDMSPKGQVPVLVTDKGQPIFESEAIVEYLDELYPSGQKVTAYDNATSRAWSYLGSNNYLVECSAMRAPDADSLRKHSEKLGQAFDKIEDQLGKAHFFESDSIGRVDIAWLPVLHRSAIIEQETGYDLVGERPKLKRWQSNLLATGLAERSVAEDFRDVFTGFYLSERTYLGLGKNVAEGGYSEGTNMKEIQA